MTMYELICFLIGVGAPLLSAIVITIIDWGKSKNGRIDSMRFVHFRGSLFRLCGIANNGWFNNRYSKRKEKR